MEADLTYSDGTRWRQLKTGYYRKYMPNGLGNWVYSISQFMTETANAKLIDCTPIEQPEVDDDFELEPTSNEIGLGVLETIRRYRNA